MPAVGLHTDLIAEKLEADQDIINQSAATNEPLKPLYWSGFAGFQVVPRTFSAHTFF